MNTGVWGRVAKFSSRTSLRSELAWKITQKLVQYKIPMMIIIAVGMHVCEHELILREEDFDKGNADLIENDKEYRDASTDPNDFYSILGLHHLNIIRICSRSMMNTVLFYNLVSVS
jgi:C4-dicarboxylate transporter